MEQKSSEKYKIGKGCVYNVNYQLIWTPKRRAKVLVGNIESELKKLIEKSCQEMEVKILTVEILSDCVNLFISCHPKISPHSVVKTIKMASSNFLRNKYPELLKIPCLWSSAYYCGTVGFSSESILRNFIENQKGK